MTNYAKDIWEMADDLRGNTDASAYKYYILGFIVYRYLSEKQAKYLSHYLGVNNDDYESDEQLENVVNKKYLKYEDTDSLLKLVLEKYGYAIKPEDTWISIITKAKNKELTLEDLQNVFSNFNENLSKIDDNSSKKYFENLFSNINLQNVGSITSMAAALSKVALKIDSINIYDEHGHDILGNIYEALIAKFSAANSAGEFYTPHMISKLLAKLTTTEIKKKRRLDIMDYTMGSGALLLTYADVVPGGHEEGTIHFYGQEILTETYNLARMNLMMHDVQYKHISLRNDDTLGEDWPMGKKMDIISANPPYSKKWDNTADRDQDPRFKDYPIAPHKPADYAFLLHGLYHLKDDGTMGIVMPHGVLYREKKEAKIRQKLVEKNMIDAVIGLPVKLFYNTTMQTSIIILKKNKNNKDIIFIDASHDFEKDKNQNHLTESNIDKIVRAYKKRRDIDEYAHVASYDEIKDNDFNLNIPRYIDNFEPEADIDLEKVRNNIATIDKKIAQDKKELDNMRKKLLEMVDTNEK